MKYKIPSSIKLLSLDIWDTLLLRLVNKPTQIFNEVGKVAKISRLLPNSLNAEDFEMIRTLAEKKARKEKITKCGHSEVLLSEIYNFFPVSVTKKEGLQNLEIATETEYSFLNTGILSLIEQAKSKSIRIVLTSDMYLNKTQLIHILESNGLNLGHLEEIYISCEYQCNKTSGGLFKKLISGFSDISPGEILHVGDKLGSDIEPAESLGIKTYHYAVIPNVMREICEYEKICQRAPRYLNSLRKIAVDTSVSGDVIHNRIGAGILGPVFTFFCDWILDISEKENINDIYPFMREAELFEPMLKNAAKKRNLKLNIHPLYVSRESTWLGSLDEWNKEECENLMGKIGITVSDVFRHLEIKLPSSINQQYLDKKVKNLPVELYSEIINFLLMNNSKQKINKIIEKKRHLLIKYLKSVVSLKKRFITIDLGFQGSINENIENTLRINNDRTDIIHCLVMGADSIIHKKMKDMDFRCFLSSPNLNQNSRKTIHKSLYTIEQSITGRIGSTKGYETVNNKVRPVFNRITIKNEDNKTKEKIHDAILNFQEIWYSIQNKKRKSMFKFFNVPTGREQLIGLMHRLIDTPTLSEANFLGNLDHDHNHGSSQVMRICGKRDYAILKSFNSEYEFLKKSRLHGIHWPQGVVTKANRYYLLKEKLEQNSSDTYLQSMNNVMEIIKTDHISRIIIYGAGEVGEATYKASEINSIDVLCVIDRKQSLWGSHLQNTKICSLNTALSEFPEIPIVIGSFEFLAQIQSTIQDSLTKLNLSNKIYSIKDLSD
ncbi:MAG: hypothetical protein ACJZ64_00315 [Opitutales bacterium]